MYPVSAYSVGVRFHLFAVPSVQVFGSNRFYQINPVSALFNRFRLDSISSVSDRISGFRSILSVSDRIDGSSQHNNSLIGLGTILSGFGLIQSFRIDSIGFLTDFIPFRSILSFLDYSIEHLTMVPVDGRCPPPPPTPLFHRAITSLCNIILHIYYNKSSICGCHHNRNMYLDMTPAAQLPLYQFNQFLLIL